MAEGIGGRAILLVIFLVVLLSVFRTSRHSVEHLEPKQVDTTFGQNRANFDRPVAQPPLPAQTQSDDDEEEPAVAAPAPAPLPAPASAPVPSQAQAPAPAPVPAVPVSPAQASAPGAAPPAPEVPVIAPPAPEVAVPSCYDRPLDDRKVNPLWTWIQSYKTGPGVHKYHQYLDAYNRHFAQYRSRDKIYMAEVGVQSGGSIEMWRAYFGADRLVYYGFDVNPKTRKFQKEGVNITLGDQGKREFWRDIKRTLPRLDIFIDDGGHMMNQQIVTFEEMFPHVKDGGIYLCEDTHTSYWPNFAGGYRKKGTWMEYAKGYLDNINAYNSKEEEFKVDDYTKHIRGMFIYDSMVFFEKGVTSKLTPIRKGDKWIPYYGNTKDDDCKDLDAKGGCIKEKKADS